MLQMSGTKLTRQILTFVALCLILAEIVIFVPSASHFQYRWFETQWQHFLVQFDKDSESDINALASSYRSTAGQSAIHFHPPQFICWQDKTGTDVTLGHKGEEVVTFNLGDHPISHLGLALSIITGGGPSHVLVYDERRDENFRATWSTTLIRSQLQDYAMRIIGLTFVIGLIIITPLYWFLSAQFVRPLRRLTDHMRRFAKAPESLLEPLDTTKAGDEISEIADALTNLTEDVRRALRQKDRLADIGAATAKIKRIAPHIERAISDAAGMTQNMMDYLTEPKAETARAFVLGEMADNLRHDAKIEVKLTGTKALYGTPNMFYRLLFNRARNAKAAGASALTIDVWRAGHLAVIDISDNGPGIDKALKPHLFSAFYSGHKSNTGLGLAIAKDLSVAMGGELRLSRSSAHGSEFRLSVPQSWLDV